jgi:hypothetical protein
LNFTTPCKPLIKEKERRRKAHVLIVEKKDILPRRLLEERANKVIGG